MPIGVREFLEAIDHELSKLVTEGETVELFLIGRSALVLGYDQLLMTKDVDILQSNGSHLQDICVNMFGIDSKLAKEYDFYVEEVSTGLPPVPIGYQQRSKLIAGNWKVIRPRCPEANDLAVTKLKRFHGKDREDLRILCDLGHLDPDVMESRLDLANSFSDPDEPKTLRMYANLRKVQMYLRGECREI